MKTLFLALTLSMIGCASPAKYRLVAIGDTPPVPDGLYPRTALSFPSERVTHFEFWQNTVNGRWYWHLKSARGEILAHGADYGSKSEALHALGMVQSTPRLLNAPVIHLTP